MISKLFKTANHETRAENVYNLTLVLKGKLILWIIVNANNKKNFSLSLENAFLHKRSSLIHKDILNSMYDS